MGKPDSEVIEKKPVEVAIVGNLNSEADTVIKAMNHDVVKDVIVVEPNEPVEKNDGLVDQLKTAIFDGKEIEGVKPPSESSRRKIYNKVMKRIKLQKKSFICDNAIEVMKKLNRKAKHNRNVVRKRKIRLGNERAIKIAEFFKNNKRYDYDFYSRCGKITA